MKTLPSTPLFLFGLERSVYTRIARLTLEEKGVPYLLQEVEIFGPSGVPEHHFDRHPFGRIPVLHDGDFSLYETSAITRYVDDAFPGPNLQPVDPRSRARMNQIIGLLDAYAYRSMVWGVFVQRVRVPLEGGIPNDAEINDSLQKAATCLNSLSILLGSAPFLTGEHISLADLHAYPILRYLCLAPEGNTLLKGYQELLRWYEAMLLRPSVFQTQTLYEFEECEQSPSRT
jgi:glutathione S-transferase